MRAIVEAVTRTSGVKRFLVREGQILKIGRTEWADVAFPCDDNMSSVHFSLELIPPALFIEDLGSTNGTSVNDIRIESRAQLQGGEDIVAGQTHFVARIECEGYDQVVPIERSTPEGPSPKSTAELPETAERRKAASPSVIAGSGQSVELPPSRGAGGAARLQRPTKVPMSVEVCESKLTLCRGDVADIAPADVAACLSRVYPVHLIVDFRHLGAPPPQELAEPHYLFDWLDPVAVPLVSPLLISQIDLVTWTELIAQGWGKDAVVAIFTRVETSALLAHFRRACKARENAVLGCCWPSVLAPLLANSRPAMVNDLLADIDAVLVELPDLPDTWQIYGGSQIVESLEHVGFVATREAQT
jgi:pSer/pThr/pTyr-binding forkhead associated (FHA) protein